VVVCVPFYSDARVLLLLPEDDVDSELIQGNYVSSIHDPERQFWKKRLMPEGQDRVASFFDPNLNAPYELVFANLTEWPRNNPDFTAFNQPNGWAYLKFQIASSILSNTGVLLVFIPSNIHLASALTICLEKLNFIVRCQPETLSTEPRTRKKPRISDNNRVTKSELLWVVVAHKSPEADQISIEEPGFYTSNFSRNTYLTEGFKPPPKKFHLSLDPADKNRCRQDKHMLRRGDCSLYKTEYNLAMLIKLMDTYSRPGGPVYDGQGGGGMVATAALRLGR
jgi:hypothetical protein